MARVSLDEVYEESSASSLAPYSSVSMFSERSRNKRVGDAEISSSDQICAWQIESIIEPNNQKSKFDFSIHNVNLKIFCIVHFFKYILKTIYYVSHLY